MRWSRRERIYSALVKYRLDIWKKLQSFLRWSRNVWTHLALVKYRPYKILTITKSSNPNLLTLNVFKRLNDDHFRCPCIRNIYNTFPSLCLASMIYTLIYFIGFDILILLTFLIFCLSVFIDNCKSPIANTAETSSSVYNNMVSSQYSPDRKSPSFRTHARNDLCVGKQQSQN